MKTSNIQQPTASIQCRTTSLCDRWANIAATIQPEPARERNGAARDRESSPALESIGLTPDEVRTLSQKFGARPTWSKTLLSLVPLANPRAGWRVLIGIVLVTPELAAAWLKSNFRNRKVSDDTVDAYARDMKQDQWVPTHQGCAFNDADQLIDGQHRLYAIIKAGIPRELMVSFGWPAKVEGKAITTMDAVDRGRTRSVGDQLTIQHGLKDGRLIASVASELANLCCPDRVRRLSVGNTLEVFHEFETAILWTIEHRSKQRGLRAAGVLAAFALALAGSDIKGANSVQFWFTALNTGKDTSIGGALARLRSFLTGEEQSLLTPGMNRGLALLTCQALYLESRGQAGKDLAMMETGAAHYRSLQPARVAKIVKLFAL